MKLKNLKRHFNSYLQKNGNEIESPFLRNNRQEGRQSNDLQELSIENFPAQVYNYHYELLFRIVREMRIVHEYKNQYFTSHLISVKQLPNRNYMRIINIIKI